MLLLSCTANVDFSKVLMVHINRIPTHVALHLANYVLMGKNECVLNVLKSLGTSGNGNVDTSSQQATGKSLLEKKVKLETPVSQS